LQEIVKMTFFSHWGCLSRGCPVMLSLFYSYFISLFEFSDVYMAQA
jgi:hypothetical protein